MKPKYIKAFLIIFLFINSIQLLAQKTDTLIAENDYSYRRFVIYPMPFEKHELEKQKELKDIKGYYLIILPPVFQTRKDTIQMSIQPFYEQTDSLAKDILIHHRYNVFDEYLKPRILNELVDKNCLNTNRREAVTIDFEKIPSLTKLYRKRIEKADYENGEADSIITIIYDYHYISKPSQIIKTSSFNPLDYDRLNNVRMHYLIGSNWSKIWEVLCPPICGRDYLEYAQLALRDRGYNVRADGIWDKATKDALIDFQIKNDLPVGRLDIDTLEKLDVYTYRDERIKMYDAYQYLNSPRFDY